MDNYDSHRIYSIPVNSKQLTCEKKERNKWMEDGLTQEEEERKERENVVNYFLFSQSLELLSICSNIDWLFREKGMYVGDRTIPSFI